MSYIDTIFDLHRRGYTVHTYDHINQGLSDRQVQFKDRQEISHIDDFDIYVSDLVNFITNVMPSTSDVCGMAHSMGCLVACLAQSQYHKLFSRLVLTSPLFGIHPMKFHFAPAWAQRILLSVLCDIFNMKEAPVYPKRKSEPVVKFSLTNDREMAEFMYNLRSELPQTITTTPTYGWLRSVLSATREFEELWNTFDTPTSVYISEKDNVVSRSKQIDFIRKAKGIVKVKKFANALHSLLLDNSTRREIIYDAFVSLGEPD